LEELAEAQAKDRKTMPKKRLKQLICTEEQQTHARQIKRVNHTLWSRGGLPKVTTTTRMGMKEHHYTKESIEEACLAKAKAQFTQANDMAFLMEPLLSELGIIGIQRMQFDQITDGNYTAPPVTPSNAQQLLPLLQWPTMLSNCPHKITPEQHKKGWKKAKETTSSSLSGAHFGHYKAGGNHKLINALHTMLTDILLRMGFLYQWWKKGINIMLEKIAGNCKVTKLQIILLFKADFNQLNKFIGKEMMYQAEENGLVAGKQYSSQHGKSAITQSLNKCLAFDLV